MKPLLFLSFLCFFVSVFSVSAEARIDILPRKLLIEDRDRSGEITVLNMGDATQIIRVTLISYRQKEDGTYEKLEETPLDPAFDPAQVVRLSPKQFSLPAQGRQKIRFTVQRPAGIPDGDYRFHVRAVSYDSEDNANGKPTPIKGNGVSLKTNLGVAIPVIVRKGSLNTAAKIENVNLLSASQTESGKPSLKFDVKRTGTASVMSVARIYWETAAEKQRQIGVVSNLNVFNELQVRSALVPLDMMPQGAGKIRVVLTNEFGNKEVLDEVVLAK